MILAHPQPKQSSWWGPVWRGLVVDDQRKHYRRLRSALWLYLYLIIHADRQTGQVIRRYSTIAHDMGQQPRTVQRWLRVLRRQNYVAIRNSGRALVIHIQQWKSLSKPTEAAKSV
jgi:hypothetical protein